MQEVPNESKHDFPHCSSSDRSSYQWQCLYGTRYKSQFVSRFPAPPFQQFRVQFRHGGVTGGSVMQHAEVTAGKVQCLSFNTGLSTVAVAGRRGDSELSMRLSYRVLWSAIQV
jgi:hypothetical protein